MQDGFTELPGGDYSRSDSPAVTNNSTIKFPTLELPNRPRSSTRPESVRSGRFNRPFRFSGLGSIRSGRTGGPRSSGVDSVQSSALQSEYSLAIINGSRQPKALTGTSTHGTPLLDIIFQNLTVHGLVVPSNVQETVLSVLEIPFRRLTKTSRKAEKKVILHDLDGVLRSGELLAVIGRPGSGCTTFLKTIAGELNGLEIHEAASINYGGIPQSRFRQYFQGEANYCPEYDHHFPHLSVQDTLGFAAGLRAPHNLLSHMKREQFAKEAVENLVSTYGLEHVVTTQVGNDFIRGVSGGERKRVSIAEMRLTGCSVSCWDQSTKGLDSQTALEFVKSLRIDAKTGSCHIASLYQVSDALLKEFDRVLVLYEGREIYFGSPQRATRYFEKQGWLKPASQPIGDFLAAITNPEERLARPKYEDRVPRTAKEFEMAWKNSPLFRKLQRSLDFHNKDASKQTQLTDSERLLALKSSRSFTNTSSYLASQWTQIAYNLQRLARRLKNDKKSIIIVAWGQTVMSLILGSLFYQTPNNTQGLFSKGGVLFASILLNAIVTITDIFQLFGNRPIIERQASYLFYHPWTEAFAGVLINIPLKFITACVFNTILYFLSGLRRTPENFFTFFLFVYIITLVMSSVFRTIGAAASALPQAFVIVGAILPMFIVYTGFVVPKPYMHVWFKWLTYINPVGYAFESLIGNEFHSRDFNCTPDRIVPPYGQSNDNGFACAVRGAVPGQAFVSGDAYINANYEYLFVHLWRNLGILLAFLFFFVGLYLYISEKNTASPLSTDTMIFRKGLAPNASTERELRPRSDVETRGSSAELFVDKRLDLVHTKTLSWSNVSYEVISSNETKRLLNGISGWIKPGTLTALMVCISLKIDDFETDIRTREYLELAKRHC
jgi:ATP-binding cassette subfamily G (WHITE) protein 2 (PDR)